MKAADPKNQSGSFTAGKIVIISQDVWITHDLIALLTALFPECDAGIAEKLII